MPDSQRINAARALLGTTPLVMRTVGRAMRLSGGPLLPQQYRLLGAIARKPRTLGHIARMQGVTPATATTLVTTLETRGWVTRQSDPEDRRRVIVTLTEGGSEVLAAGQRVAESAMAEMLAPLSAEQLGALLAGLAVLNDIGSGDPCA